ncbi:hypothetical protein FOA43_002358 [Brettanomyces nanus]|uniref:Uncharacterized protein n=1 Tax=Eeniella nana TaxID=13502 RepID=A0A875S241_EENNA|nr:uncharacterized protein FOA43_002358 [Brettanomyces nanus]QPG75018.1 hypothetical protein FOA43_002358 [Brettanomyces nanus]
MDDMEDKESDLERLSKDKKEETGKEQGNESDEEMEEADEEEEIEEKKKEAEEKREIEEKREGEENEREQFRTGALNELKDIEIEFATLKDKLYETQLKKLELELKLCEMNKHPDFLYFMKMIDENFKGQIERSINLQKYRLRCLNSQTGAYRVQIHQQFIRNCEDLKYGQIRKITSDWYEINKERRTMDTASLQTPEYYQYNENITADNVESQESISKLVRQRNSVYKEIGNMQALIKYQKVFPSSLNNLEGCDSQDMAQDLRQMNIKPSHHNNKV